MDFLDDYFKYDNGSIYSGLTDTVSSLFVCNLFKKNNQNIILLTSTLYEANKLFNNLSLLCDNVLLFPMDDFLSSLVLASSPELKYKRLETLDRLKENKKFIIVANLMAYLKCLPNKNVDNSLVIELGKEYKRNDLLEALSYLGYDKESLVTMSSEYAIRGFIVDIFPIGENHPIRIEFDGDLVAELKYFDENTQKSLENTSKIVIKAVDEVKTDKYDSLFNYANNPIVVYYNQDQILASYTKLLLDIENYQNSNDDFTNNILFNLDDIKVSKDIYLNTISSLKNNLNCKEIINYNQDFELLKTDYDNYINCGKKVLFCLNNKQEEKFLKKCIPKANVIIKSIASGFILDNYVVISSNDIEKVKHNIISYKNNLKIGKKINNYNQLSIGDYVVHISHGIGIYKGISTISVHGCLKDFLTIYYQDNDKIYVPVEKIDSIFMYTNKDGVAPKLNKLGSSNWEKTKKYIASKVKDISQELIKLYQERIALKKESYKDYLEEDIFGSEFIYELTKDQDKAISDIKEDMKKGIPMERLLCGDVGFGKTEVAMRAMFKTVLNNEQVMYLCPTTILSKQQFNVAKARFNNWPIEIELLNRHVTTKEAHRIIEGFKKGSIDILIGTHRILSDDVKPHKLGLLVIDEEQRFGVAHKEKIKKLKNDIHVLSLSATPIPRTLKMALSGLRDLSVIDTPPVNRFPVQTYVMVEDDYMIKDAIYKELSRNGQIFVLYNRIESIVSYTDHIKSLVPDARIIYAHGRMEKNELDDIMSSFINGDYDILICTTIIESGIDIPNVNTLIIHDADNFGLSQLYQIRGRVGRSDRVAYAYLMYKKDKMLNDIAIKRLNTIKEFTELGSGYKIAMRDLSLRGAGDVFGSSQAGFVDSVGIQLYMKMVEDEIKRQRGEEVVEDESVNSLINVATHISDDYVSDEDIKIEIHQKINEIDSYHKLLEIKNELEDRFGKVNNDLLVYMYEEWFEKIAKKNNITRVIQNDQFVQVFLPEEVSNNIKGDKLFLEAMNLSTHFNIGYTNKEIKITLYIKPLEKHFIFYLVALLEKVL